MTRYFNPETQCANKVQYTKAQAKTAGKKRESEIGKRLRVYHCPHCTMYHLGNPVHQTADLTPAITEDMRFKARRAQVTANARAERAHRTA